MQVGPYPALWPPVTQILAGMSPSGALSGVQQPAAGKMDVTWSARGGTTYQVFGSQQVDGPYALAATVTATNLGPLTLSLPTDGNAFFFRVQELP